MPRRVDRGRPQRPVGPAIDPANVVDQLALGEETDADKVVQGGFRKLTDGRWVSLEYVQTVEGRDCG